MKGKYKERRDTSKFRVKPGKGDVDNRKLRFNVRDATSPGPGIIDGGRVDFRVLGHEARAYFIGP